MQNMNIVSNIAEGDHDKEKRKKGVADDLIGKRVPLWNYLDFDNTTNYRLLIFL